VTLLQLEYFVAAVEHGSFSAPAAALHVAQPSLSEQIRRLEDRLGVVLFVRTNRRLVLTEAGQLLLPRARSVLEAAEGWPTPSATGGWKPAWSHSRWTPRGST
jgi:DNA-binding transcriptional LysR family regulator